MKLPSDIAPLLARRFEARRGQWLATGSDGQEWPWRIDLGVPSESAALQQTASVKAWVAAWHEWQGPGELQWCERRWRVLGSQQLPQALSFSGPGQVAAALDQGYAWARAAQRSAQLLARWPALSACVGRHYEPLAQWSDADVTRLVDVLAWLQAHPDCGLYIRQLPIAGVDTKWIEARKGMLHDMAALLLARPGDGDDLYSLCGLRRLPALVRIRLLDAALRAHCGGLDDISAPLAQLAALGLKPAQVLVVENLQTGLALPDMAGTVAIIGLGYGVEQLASLPWIAQARCRYWGDIDTHGYAILARARACVPHVESLMMDQASLLAHRALWATEDQQCGAGQIDGLNEAERAVYADLKAQRWGQNVRLEQERIALDYALARLGGQ